MTDPCRFDPRLLTGRFFSADGGAGRFTGQWRLSSGHAIVAVYHCDACGEFHWSAPALECDGSSPDLEGALRDANAASERDGHPVPERYIAQALVHEGRLRDGGRSFDGWQELV